jgi:parallel beta-helix repeat protein
MPNYTKKPSTTPSWSVYDGDVEMIGRIPTEYQADMTIRRLNESYEAGKKAGGTVEPTPTPTPTPTPDPSAIVVKSATELVAAAKQGGVKLIRPAAGATFGSVSLVGCGDATLEGFTFTGSVSVKDSEAITLLNCTHRVSATTMAIAGNSGTSKLVVDGSNIIGADFGFSGTPRGAKFLRCRANGLWTDFIQIGGGTRDLEVGWCYASDWNSKDTHRDFVQFGTWNTDSTGIARVHIHDNVGFMGKGPSFQFIYLGNEQNEPYVDFLIENNLCHQNHAHGITIKDCTQTTVRNNTVISAGDNKTGVNVDNSEVNTIQNNIANAVQAGNGNIIFPAATSPFVNHVKGVYTLENFRVKPGVTAGADVSRLPQI